jgi:hypothetical protein
MYLRPKLKSGIHAAEGSVCFTHTHRAEQITIFIPSSSFSQLYLRLLHIAYCVFGRVYLFFSLLSLKK